MKFRYLAIFTLAIGWITNANAGLSELDTLLDQYRPEPAKTLATKNSLRQAPPPTENAEELAQFYLGRARAAGELGLIQSQLADLRQAKNLLGTNPSLSEPNSVAKAVYSDLEHAEQTGGNYVSALAVAEAVANTGKGNIPWLAKMAILHANIGDLNGAQRYLGQANARFSQAYNNPKNPNSAIYGDAWIAQVEMARAKTLNLQGKFQAAEAAMRKSNQKRETFIQFVQQSEAISPIERIKIIGENALDGPETFLAKILRTQGNFNDSELVLRNVLKRQLSRYGKYHVDTARTIQSFSNNFYEQGRYQDALNMAKRALDILTQLGASEESLSVIQCRRSIGSALTALEQWQAALQPFEQIRLSLEKDPGLKRLIGGGNLDWAVAMIHTGQALKAQAMLQAMLEKSTQQLGDQHPQTAEKRGVLAMAQAASGDFTGAEANFRPAVEVLFAEGLEEQLRTPAHAKRLQWIFLAYLDTLVHLREQAGSQADPRMIATMFQLAEASRNQSVQKALISSAARFALNSPGIAELVRQEQDQSHALELQTGLLLSLLGAAPEQQIPAAILELQRSIASLKDSHQRLHADIQQRYPAYSTLMNPQPATVKDVQTALKEGEVLLSFLPMTGRTLVWAIAKQGGPHLHISRLTQTELAQAVAAIRRTLIFGEGKQPAFATAEAYTLYRELIAPLESDWGRAENLLISASGSLGQIPFSLLATQPPQTLGPEQQSWLIDRVAISHIPTAASLIALHSDTTKPRAEKGFIGFGDPAFDFRDLPAKYLPGTISRKVRSIPFSGNRTPPAMSVPVWDTYARIHALPDTREEILSIARILGADQEKDIFLGKTASRQTVKTTRLDDRQIVAFATHGLVPGDFPGLDQPALALANPGPNENNQDGFLTLEDILGLKLNADLVVLSACNTAAGDAKDSEALSGLGRGFFFAGSKSLLVTHWPVETESARQLVTGFFQALKAKPQKRALALRTAMLALRNTPATEHQAPPYSHPIYWAPYTLVGEGF